MSLSENRVIRVVAGGLFALFVALIVAALTVFGVINLTLGHILLLIAALVGALIIFAELIPGKPPKHKIVWSLLLFGIVGMSDYQIVKYKRSESAPLSFHAILVAVGNMPERSSVKTWDDKPWDETLYADVRLSIHNPNKFALQNLNLRIDSSQGNVKAFMMGIGQLSDVSGVDFHKPFALPDLTVPLRGKDGKRYLLPVPMDKMDMPTSLYSIHCPRIDPGETLRLIIATTHAVAPAAKEPPDKFKITGTYEVLRPREVSNEAVDEYVSIEK